MSDVSVLRNLIKLHIILINPFIALIQVDNSYYSHILANH